MIKLLYVGIGGFTGCCLRYIITQYSSKWFGNHISLGTLIVNILGGILIGFLMELVINSNSFNPNLKIFLITGLLGGLTTFSGFSYETVSLFYEGKHILGIINGFLNIILSLTGVILGKYSFKIICML